MVEEPKLDSWRLCICGQLTQADLVETREQFAICLCGETLTIRGGATWHLQHGPNPEHRSPDYLGCSLIEACDWVDSVCLASREGKE